MRLGIDRDRFFAGWARLATGRPWAVVAVGSLLAVLGVAAAGGAFERAGLSELGFRGDRSELVDPGLDWQRRYAAYKERFPRWNDAVVVARAGGNEGGVAGGDGGDGRGDGGGAGRRVARECPSPCRSQ